MDPFEDFLQENISFERHNHQIAVYNHGHAQTTRLTEEQLQQTEQFRKSHVPPRNILRFFLEQDVGCAVRYNVPLLEVVEMTPIRKNFTVATAFMCNEQATTHRWVLQQIKHLYVSSAMSTGSGSIVIDEDRLEIKRAGEISDDPQSKCGHYLWKSHGLPCECELFARYQHVLLLQPEDVYIFWRKLEIGVDIPSVYERDMDSEMRDLTFRDVCLLVKGVISPVLPDNPYAPSTTVLPLYSNMDCTLERYISYSYQTNSISYRLLGGN
ncbi:hypothetical protein M9H77_08192 [Catharanthus roseus]|uniref:Uncharacterized protein n=1 Tax=Catharanthus roseus TaxID=4058 RepID=A0ACC0BX12_CATRO|nr:hypothetical protein M9H77_08192 [Catharanthus roseus]